MVVLGTFALSLAAKLSKIQIGVNVVTPLQLWCCFITLLKHFDCAVMS